MKKILLVVFLVIFLIAMFQTFFPHAHQIDVIKAKSATESQVIRVVDGDTIVVALHHKPETIRLLGIDTPETVKPNAPVECYGSEASKHTKEILTDKIVRLESDPSQDNRDKYHRLLRYVFLENPRRVSSPLPEGGVRGGREGTGEGLSVNETLVHDGYAREYTFNKKNPYKYQKQFRADQKIAKKNKIGLWGVCF